MLEKLDLTKLTSNRWDERKITKSSQKRPDTAFLNRIIHFPPLQFAESWSKDNIRLNQNYFKKIYFKNKYHFFTTNAITLIFTIVRRQQNTDSKEHGMGYNSYLPQGPDTLLEKMQVSWTWQSRRTSKMAIADPKTFNL